MAWRSWFEDKFSQSSVTDHADPPEACRAVGKAVVVRRERCVTVQAELVEQHKHRQQAILQTNCNDMVMLNPTLFGTHSR